MRRLFLLFVPAFITPCLVGFVIPLIALQSMDMNLRETQFLYKTCRVIGTSGAKYTSGQDTATLSGTWVLQPVLPSDTSTDKIPYIHFDLEKSEFSGFTGCNRMNGRLRLEGDRLTFDPNLSLTKMVCQGYNEKAFIANLLRVTRYKISEGILELRIDNLPVSKWVRKTRPAPIEKSA
jgi:heat shock protein HslJ